MPGVGDTGGTRKSRKGAPHGEAEGQDQVPLQRVRKLRSSPEVAADLTGRAEKIADAAGDGFEVHDATAPTGATRARAIVVTDTYEARLVEATDKALTSAIGVAGTRHAARK